MLIQKKPTAPFTKVKKNDRCLLLTFRQLRRVVLMMFLLTSLFITSCAPLNTMGEQIQIFFWDIQKNMRKPGEKLITHPNQVWKKYNCGEKNLPFFVVETNEILPPQLYAGKEMNHHFEYVMCPAKPSEVIRGCLTRLIYYKSHIVFKDVDENFEFKPGEWSVDAFITIPPEAEPGVYSLEVNFSKTKHSFSKNEHFIVKPSS